MPVRARRYGMTTGEGGPHTKSDPHPKRGAVCCLTTGEHPGISMPLPNRPSTLEFPCRYIVKNKSIVTVYVDEWIYTYSTSYIFLYPGRLLFTG